MKPYEPPPKELSKNMKQHSQDAQPIPVPSLDDVQPFMSAPDFVEKPGSGLEALLRSQYVQNPYPYPETTDPLPSYSTKTPESRDSSYLRKRADHALAHSWKYDPFCCSVRDAFKFSQDPDNKPNHGLTESESQWVLRARLTTVPKARSPARVGSLQAWKGYKWMKTSDEEEEILNFDHRNIGREIDEFYGPDGTDLRPINNDSDEGYSEPNDIARTIVSLPDKSLLEEGVTPGGIFHDSGISMDEGYAKYSLAHSLHILAKEIVAMPSDGPAFPANLAPFRSPQQAGRWLELIGDQKQCDWPGRRQGPYDLDGLRSPKDVKSKPRKATSQSSNQEKRSVVRGNPEGPVSNVELENNEVSVGAIHPMSKERSTKFPRPIRNGSDNVDSVPASHPIPKVPQIDDDACRSIPDMSFNTPVKHRINQIQQVQLKTPETPATVDIHLTPERKNDAIVGDVSNGSLETRLPNFPFTNRGQSELDPHVQEANPYSDFAREDSSAMSLDGSELEEDPLILPLERPSQSKVHARSSKDMEFQRNESNAMSILSPPKPSQDPPSSPKKASTPATPANAVDSALFRPVTPFQLGTSASNVVFDSPGTPTPAPRGSQAKEKSVSNIFKSPKLGSRSPERARPNPDIFVVNPTVPVAGATDQHRANRGLLFERTKKKERVTMNVLNSLKLPSPERGRGGAGGAILDDFEDELTTASGGEVFKGGRSAVVTRSDVGFGVRAGRKVAQAIVVPEIRARDEDEGDCTEEVQPRTKKARLSTKV